MVSVVTAVTTNTRPQRVFSSVQTCVLVDVNQQLPWFFTHRPREDSFPVSGALGRACPFLQYFATRSDTASCQDYEEYEVFEFLSEETRIGRSAGLKIRFRKQPPFRGNVFILSV